MDVKISKSKLVLMMKNRIQLIPLNEILFIEHFNQKTYINLSEHEFQLRFPLKHLEGILPSNFKRTHRSFIVNTNLVLELTMVNENTYEAHFAGDKQALVAKETVNYII